MRAGGVWFATFDLSAGNGTISTGLDDGIIFNVGFDNDLSTLPTDEIFQLVSVDGNEMVQIFGELESTNSLSKESAIAF